MREKNLKNQNRSVFFSKSNINGLWLFAANNVDVGQFVLDYRVENSACARRQRSDRDGKFSRKRTGMILTRPASI